MSGQLIFHGKIEELKKKYSNSHMIMISKPIDSDLILLKEI